MEVAVQGAFAHLLVFNPPEEMLGPVWWVCEGNHYQAECVPFFPNRSRAIVAHCPIPISTVGKQGILKNSNLKVFCTVELPGRIECRTQTMVDILGSDFD